MVKAGRILCITLLLLVLLGSATIIRVPMVRGGGAYRVSVTITERSGNNLYNYTIKIELNSTNFNGWDHVSENGSDIYFLDVAGSPLYYWIKYFNKTEQKAVIWVKIPCIPANSTVKVYMYYGAENLYSSYNDPQEVFLVFDDFSSDPTSNYVYDSYDYSRNFVGMYNISNIVSSLGTGMGIVLEYDIEPLYYISVQSNGVYIQIGLTASTSALDLVNEVYPWSALETTTCSGVGYKMYYLVSNGDGSSVMDVPLSQVSVNTWYHVRHIVTSSKQELIISGYANLTTTEPMNIINLKYIAIWGYADPVNELAQYDSTDKALIIQSHRDGNLNYKAKLDNIKLYKYVDPEPSVLIGFEELAVGVGVGLPSETLYLEHSIVYSPDSTQFSHSFTATNTSTAGYETNYSDIYGWRVYADPYEVNGAYYGNNASLVSEMNITLPYSEVLVKNVTLLARTNGTGNFRQLWIRLLNSTGAVIAELTNATIGTSWTEVSLPINANVSRQVTIWINATVASTATAGEEIAVRDVMLFVEYSANPEVVVETPLPNVEYFNCSAIHYVELGSSEYLNSSVITFKLIDYLTLNATDYPVQPSYVGNETIGSYSYSVYRIESANYSQAMTIYALLENRLKTFRIHAKGYDTETILIGEPITIELPELGNITIVEFNRTFINVSSVTVSFSSTGSYTIVANLTQPMLWKIGYGVRKITVKYGAFSVKPIDVDSKVVDYEDLVLQLINKTDGSVVREVVGNQLFSLDSLWAGNYSIVVRFKDIVIGTRDFELNITTDASEIDIPCTMRILAKDYRGLNRTIIYEHSKRIVGIGSLSIRFPYSRMRVLLNGTGSFKLYINYRGDLPTKVKVVGNVTNLQYHWDGNYLVITGTLGSIGELNITDLYKLRVEMYDRLGNLMPSWVYAYVNGTKYSGSVVEDYYCPEDYIIELPKTINGFEFYGFFDGYNETTRAITINSSDVTLKAWYRVPTSIEEVKSYQVASLWWLPFVRQEGETVRVYVEGCLKDYYGNGVPNKPLIINITNVETGYTRSYSVTTDASGYFRTPLVELLRGKTYRVKVIYNGDDVYVGTMSTAEVKPEELPTAPTVFEVPIDYILVVVGVALIIVGIAAAVRASKHVIEDVRKKTRRFVREK